MVASMHQNHRNNRKSRENIREMPPSSSMSASTSLRSLVVPCNYERQLGSLVNVIKISARN
jgi:hypothetical protein